MISLFLKNQNFRTQDNYYWCKRCVFNEQFTDSKKSKLYFLDLSCFGKNQQICIYYL